MSLKKQISQFYSRTAVKLLPWFKQGSWTVLDQALFAGSNFMLHILLVRWLAPEVYGAFTVAYTIFILIATLHTGMLTEPMLVFGPGRYRESFPQYLWILIKAHARLTLLAAVFLATIGSGLWITGTQSVGLILLVLAFTQPLLLLLWLMRRACYVVLKPAWAASGGMLYGVLILAGLYSLHHTTALSAESGLVLMGMVSLITSVWIGWFLYDPQYRNAGEGFEPTVHRHHWKYGKWASATGALQWLPGHLAFLVLPLWAGLSASGTLKALLNMVMPAANVYGALSVLLIPVFVKARSNQTLRQKVFLTISLVIMGTSCYWILLGYWGEQILGWLYNGQYAETASLLWLVGALPVLSGISAILCTALRALERPNHIFGAHLASSLFAISVGILLIREYALVGALVGFLLQMVIEIGIMTYLWLVPSPFYLKFFRLSSPIPQLHDAETNVLSNSRHINFKGSNYEQAHSKSSNWSSRI